MLQKGKRLFVILSVMLCFCLLPLMAQAAKVSFFKLPDYSKTEYYFGNIQAGTNKFEIFNKKEDSLLSHIYFYNFSGVSIPNIKVVDANFNTSATPTHLPGLYSPPIQPDYSFKFASPRDRITFDNSIVFEFEGLGYDTLSYLFNNNSLVAGLFVQDYMDGQSAHFASVPLPASFVLLLSGLAGLAWARRRLGV